MVDIADNLGCAACVLTNMKGIFSADDLCVINANKSEMLYNPGDIILKQGSFVSQVLYLKKGLVKIVLEGSGDRNMILQFVENQNFIALPVLGGIDKYPFSVIAITECSACFIRRENIATVMGSNKEANNYLLHWYSNDYQYIYNRIVTISSRNSHGKLAAALLYLANGKFTYDVLNIISRRELAELAVISIESLNKILLQLKNDSIIEIGKKGIVVKRLDLIEKLCTVG